MRFPGYFLVANAMICCALLSGCATLRSNSRSFANTPIACDGGCDDACDSCNSFQTRVVRGRPYPLLDRTGSLLGFPNKLALWDKRADNHDIGSDTESAVVSYLDQNGLDSVLVRVNQYDPVDEWRRMTSNDKIAAPWRYTFGTYDWLKYTLFPGRLSGGDWYNPFSDSLHLYSDIPSIAIAKAAYAKDVHARQLPGTYAAIQDAPIFGLWHETLANQEAIEYLKVHGTAEQKLEAERILYPDYGGAWGAQVFSFLPYGNVYGRAVGALAGHTVRTVKNSTSSLSEKSTLR